MAVTGGTRFVAMFQLAGGIVGAMLLLWQLTSTAVSERAAAIRVAVPLGYLPLLMFLVVSLLAGAALWRGMRGGHRLSLLVALTQLIQINTPYFQCYLASPMGWYLTFFTDPAGSISWADYAFEAEVGLKYGLSNGDGAAPGWVRLNVLALGFALYLAGRVLDAVLPTDRTETPPD